MRTFVAIAVFGLLAASFVAAQEAVTDAGIEVSTRNGSGINGGGSAECDCNVFQTIRSDLERIRQRVARRRDAVSQIISRAVGGMIERIQDGAAGGGGVGNNGVGSNGVGSSGVGSSGVGSSGVGSSGVGSSGVGSADGGIRL